MGRPVRDLTGQQFGYLTVLERDTSAPMGAGKSAYWLCKCKCGNICSIRTDKLTKEITKSCGCYSKEVRTQLFLDDLTGQQFGHLIVLERDTTKPMGKGKFAYWKCKCDCGNIHSVRGDHLRNKTTQSCGCLNSLGEEVINKILSENHIDYTTQYEFSDLRGESAPLRFDFAIFQNGQLSCLIEYQGDQHYRKWGNEPIENFERRLDYDQRKIDYCNIHDIKLILIPYTNFNKLNIQYLNEVMGL